MSHAWGAPPLTDPGHLATVLALRAEPMKIALDAIKASPRELAYTEQVDELNERLARGVHDYHFPGGLTVSLEHYRSGLEVFFQGSLQGVAVGRCARCAEEYSFQVEHAFAFVLVPRAANVDAATKLAADDLALSTYEGDEIDLTPLLHEQTMLALPTRPLCRESCLGLCARCGANLNAGPCACPAVTDEPRLAVLHRLVRGR